MSIISSLCFYERKAKKILLYWYLNPLFNHFFTSLVDNKSNRGTIAFDRSAHVFRYRYLTRAGLLIFFKYPTSLIVFQSDRLNSRFVLLVFDLIFATFVSLFHLAKETSRRRRRQILLKRTPVGLRSV